MMRESIKGRVVGEVDGPNQVETNRLWSRTRILLKL